MKLTRMKNRTLIISIGLILFTLIGCVQHTEPSHLEPTEPELAPDYDEELVEQFNIYLEGFSMEGTPSYEPIDEDLLPIFVKPALENKGSYFFSENFEYSFGEMEYINTNFIALSFMLEGDDGYNLLNAKIIATYDVVFGDFIDSEVIGESSEFELGTLHTNDCDYTIIILDEEEEIALEIPCQLTVTTFEDRDGDKPTTEKFSYTYLLDQFGHFTIQEE